MYKISLRITQQLRFAYHPASVVSCARKLADIDDKCCLRVCSRAVTTNTGSQYLKELINNGKWNAKNALRKVGFFDISKSILRRNAYYIYDEIADKLDYEYFFKKFNMPDTFYSWFLVVELHVWIILVRLMVEAEEGRFVRNNIIEAMWNDVNKKSAFLGAENVSSAKAQIKVLSEEFQAALLGYDEGLLGDDTVLAGALWRRFFCKECNDPELVELLVKFIRRQVKYFDSLPREDIIVRRNYKWYPIEENKS